MTDCRTEKMIDLAIEDATNGRISRRWFMEFTAAMGLSAIAGSSLWTKAAQAAPVRGGNFRVGIHDGNTSDSHDPGTYATRQMVYLAHQHRSYLTLIEPDGTLGPDLATEWSPNKDATEWAFKLNPKAYFHSGRKVAAGDVVASMNYHRNEKSTSAARGLIRQAVDVVADGDDIVIFKLGAGTADWPWLMTDYHLAVCPANDDGTIDWQSGDGSGPYKLNDGQFGVRWKLSRHDQWHLKGAYFDTVEMIVLNDDAARQSALIAGEVDVVSSVSLKTLDFLARNPGIKIDNVPSASPITMPMLCDTAPFNNVDVRNALKSAIDREDIIQRVMRGNATIGNDFHLSPTQPFWPSKIPQIQYDPDRARSLLKKAGMENLSVAISVSDSLFPGAVDLCSLYQQHALKAGINLTVDRQPADGYYSEVWMKKPFCVASWGARPTADVIFTEAYKSGAPWNESHWENPQFDKLLLRAKSELEEGKRAEMYEEMCSIARDDGGTIIPMFSNFVYARRANVAHEQKLAASWELDGARAPSRWWFAN
jgi:peptide/nickel transport system substrate-binding protein